MVVSLCVWIFFLLYLITKLIIISNTAIQSIPFRSHPTPFEEHSTNQPVTTESLSTKSNQLVDSAVIENQNKLPHKENDKTRLNLKTVKAVSY